MESTLSRCGLQLSTPSVTICVNHKLILQKKPRSLFKVHLRVHSDTAIHYRKLPKYQRYPKLPPDSRNFTFLKPRDEVSDHPETDAGFDGEYGDPVASSNTKDDEEGEDNDEHDDVWEKDEIEAITSLFQGRIPQKPGKLNRERPLPLPLPYKVRPLGFPTVKRHVRASSSSLPAVSSRLSQSKRICKDPVFLVNLARQIRSLPADQDASSALVKWGKFLRKGSLSLTIRELGHMGLPERALETFCWAQKQTHLFPDDRILAATVETLATAHEFRLPYDLKKFVSLASRSVLEAMARGFIKAGSSNLAWKLLSAAKKGKRMLGSSVYAKLILKLGKNPDKEDFVIALLEDLAERDSLDLSPQDCSALMKVCARLNKFEFVECFFEWFRNSGNQSSVVMYTTVIHSRMCAQNYREALALVWEMERLNYLYDLPAYRVAIKLFVALNDLPRAVRYFSKMKEAGFSPTYDLYRDMILIYLLSGRIAKCRELSKELELAGYTLDAELRSKLLQRETTTRSTV
ncbi:hypothetical protein RND81_03G125400 [Saponaria officinalis]|uniref:Pentatricopeptide repeat-containing protein n=1 Tax=Saponaria officinalis TaxID=3572 RepID=A0AAW1M8F0_SAPOF